MTPVEVNIDRPAGDEGGGRRHPNTCPGCRSHYRDDELRHAQRVCAQCGHHFAVGAMERIEQLVDPGTFVEIGGDLRAADPLAFVDLKPYTDRLMDAEIQTGLGDSLVAGHATIVGRPSALAVMDFSFMGGSMGSVMGERFCLAADHAERHGVPLISVTASGGARMQENILALMQMAKTVGAVDGLREAGLPYISILAHPTTGGVIASFASLGDVVIAEPGALLSFAGPRVVEQTTGEKTAPDFGRAESNLRLGQLDAVVPRRELRGELAKLLMLFSPAEDEPTGDHEPLMTIVEGESNPIDRVLGRIGLGRRRG
ncbi:MAG: acetyl-CoA carboxylase, carboxyltransferase subunit beta [Gaiellales bacterium]